MQVPPPPRAHSTLAIATLPPAQAATLLSFYTKAVAIKRRQTLQGLGLLLAVTLVSAFVAEVDLVKLFVHFGNLISYVGRLAHLDTGASVLSDLPEWFWGWKKWLRLMGETLLIAYVGTMMGGLCAFACSFLASRNMAVSKLSCFVTRRCLEFSRTVPEIVFALIFVIAFGLGPVPGVLAIALHTMGALGKLFSEVVENIDMKPVEGVAASGGSWLAQVRYGAVPQVLSNFASYALLRFEMNVRGAAVMGFVGAGGIGATLIESIRKFYYSDVSAILVLIIITVMLIDYGTEQLRHILIGKEARA
ncbi:MAG: phosphonate ABC transporter, permease protein PhnE [Rhizobiales bacterium]|nr:phosphonate ABC transporter, permease protein PhnE [Hyphomicrobiales bacterium]